MSEPNPHDQSEVDAEMCERQGDCTHCGGSGLRADELGEDAPEVREMLDSTRCHVCGGSGRGQGPFGGMRTVR